MDFFGPSWSQSDLLVAAAADSPLPSDHWTSEHAYQMGSASLPLLPKAQEVSESNATKIRVYKLQTTTNKIYNLNEHMQSCCRCIWSSLCTFPVCLFRVWQVSSFFSTLSLVSFWSPESPFVSGWMKWMTKNSPDSSWTKSWAPGVQLPSSPPFVGLKKGELLALVPHAALLIRASQPTRCYPSSCHSAVAIRPIHLDLREDFSDGHGTVWITVPSRHGLEWLIKHTVTIPPSLESPSHSDLVLTRDGWIHPDQSFQDLGSGLAKLLAWSEGVSRISRRSSYTEPPLTLCRYSRCPRRTARARSWWKKQLKHFRNSSCWSTPYIYKLRHPFQPGKAFVWVW